MNFKGVEKFFLKLLFTGQSFKVSFRNVLGLLVVPPTLFQVAFGHRASWALSFLGFGPIQRVHDMSPHEGHRSFWLIRLFRPAFVFFCSHDAYGCFERGFGAGGSYPSTSPAAHSLGPSSAAG